MSRLTAFRILPQTPFHLGERGVGLEGSAELIHSDTLYSALCSAWRLLGLLDEGPGFSLSDPPFRLSSMFPYVPTSKEMVFFFPRPQVSVAETGRGDRAAIKREKQVRFVSRDILDELIAGRLPLGPQTVQEGAALVSQGEGQALRECFPDDVLWSSGNDAARQRVTVDRLTNYSETWFVGGLVFRAGIGLYFLFDGDAECRKRVRQGLEVLQHEGLGGERTYGFGHFELEDDTELMFADTGDAHLCLGLYNPAGAAEAATALGPAARYRVATRAGFLHSPDGASFRRQGIRMVAEGALLSAQVKGRVHDVRPKAVVPPFPHPVFRFGRPVTIPGRFLDAERSPS